jgi:hypothetical protein
MTYACPVWEFAADSHLSKLHRLRTVGNLPRRTPTHDFHVTLKIPYLHDSITKFGRQQASVVQNHGNINFHKRGQGEYLSTESKKDSTLLAARRR